MRVRAFASYGEKIMRTWITRFVRCCVSGAFPLFLLMKPLIPSGSVAAIAACSLACAMAPVQAGEAARKSYDIAAGDAVSTLKRFADESARQVLFLVDAVRGVTTNPVRGEYTVREALTRLVAETRLVVVEDAKSGALMVNRLASREPTPSQPEPKRTANPMKSPRTLLAVLAVWISLGSGADAQTAATAPADEKAIVLNPFVVEATEDKGYRATSTLAGTRIRTDLKDIGAALSVVTEQFLKDTGARNSEDLLVYTTGTEVAGVNGNFSSVTGQGQTTLNEAQTLLRPNTQNRVRGLRGADNARDFFLTDIPWDSYNVGRVDLQRGPNSILFGQGQPSGIINAGVNAASFKNSNQIENRIGSFGTNRVSLDFNHVVLKNELALRISALDDHTKYRQDPAFNRDRRIYGALRYDPAFLNKSSAKTSLRLNYEAGDIKSNRPRSLPPIDRVSPFFRTGSVTIANNPAGTGTRTVPALNRTVYDNWDAWNYRSFLPGSTGARNAQINVNGVNIPNPNFQPQIAEFFTSGSFLFYPDPASSAQATSGVTSIVGESGKTTRFGIGPNGQIDSGVGGIPFARFLALANPFQAAQNEGRPFVAQWKDNSITDTSLFNFYNRLLDGPSKSEFRKFEVLNVALSQTFLHNRLGFDLAFDHQKYRDGQNVILEGRQAAITVDLNQTLHDNSPNPNAGRPLVMSRTQFGSGGRETERNSLRATGFAELRAADFLGASRFTRLLGRHVFTGLYSKDRYDVDDRQWARFLLDEGFSQLTGQANSFDAREVGIMTYLGPDLRTRTSASGLNLPNVTALQSPTTAAVRYFDSRWNRPTGAAVAGYVNPADLWVNPFTNGNSTQSENPANYGGWTNYNATVLNAANGDLARLTRQAQKNRNDLTAKAVVWQGFFWDGVVVPTLGYREDSNKVFTTAATATSAGWVNTDRAVYQFAATPRETLKTINRSQSVVVHTPRFLKEKLPLGTHLSVFYNRSSNFEPIAGRVDHLNQSLSPPSGDTKDYGVVLSTLNDRLTLKINWFESKIKNTNFGWSGAYWVGSMESRAWVMAKRFEAGLAGTVPFDSNYNYGQSVNGVFTQTPEDRALQQKHVTAVLAAFPTELFNAWAIPTTPAKWGFPPASASFDTNAPFGRQPPGYTVTQDLQTKGQEYELSFNPLSNWTITANASQTRAVSTNNIGNLVGWIEARNKIWNGDAGQIRLFGGATGSGTILQNWNSSVYSPYLLETGKNGLNVAELRPWRFNIVTNYNFSRQKLKGLSVGGGFRWEDQQAIGYRGKVLTLATGATVDSFDVASPVLGPAEKTIDLWTGYERKLTQSIKWRIQLNIRNAAGKNELIPISIQPDGTFSSYRIKDGPSWTLTNTFSF
ncbi:MAG: TonB-dependent receptor [Opitutaceae bacterium]|nr:TonB-dependent receptor [Opitutaceae bacterium]